MAVWGLRFIAFPPKADTHTLALTASTPALHLPRCPTSFPQAPNEASLCYREQYDEWAERYGVQVITSTRDTFADMFDDDQTLM